MSVSSDGFKGVFGVNDALFSLSQRRRLQIAAGEESEFPASGNLNVSALLKIHPFAGISESNRRRLSGASAVLSNPIVTIYEGDSIVFDVSKTSYPVYVKDSLLNTNPTFDYSAFRNLQSTAATSITFSTFSFTFTTAGTYVFSTSSDSSAITLVIVLASNIAQKTTAQFVEFSENNLIVSGVKSDDNIVVSPDWNLVIGLLLGMLAIVVLVVAFLYYFRKKSWSYHTNIDNLYRKNNKNSNFDGKGAGKGGIFSKNNKVFADSAAANQGKEEIGALKDEDLESPAFPTEEENVDEDGLLPELAKHLQSHHDEIDRQLINQNDILSALQETLKKEVDELKSLLQNTAMEISLNASSEQRNKKLQTILLQLRADALARDSFENNSDTTERRIIASIGQLKQILQEGPGNVATSIVHDLSEQAMNLSNLDEQVTGMHSPLLQQLGEYLGQMAYFTNNDFYVSIDEEKRRRKAAEDSFETSLKNLQSIIFPADVLDCWKVSKDCDLVTDLAMDNTLSVLRSFCDHIPQFVNFMTDAQASFNRGLSRTVEKGNPSLIEREQELAKQSFSGYLNDLLEAISILEAALTERLNNLVDSASEGKSSREKLIEAIDAALLGLQANEGMQPVGADANSIQQLLEPLLAALREGRTLPVAASQSEEQNLTETLAVIPEDESENVVGEVLANDNLTTSQKETILESAEQDQRRIENLMELEERRKDEEIQKALEIGDADTSEDKFMEEQKKLEEELKRNREEELANLEGDLDETKIMQYTDLLTKLRSLVVYRGWTSWSRAKYRHFMVDRLVMKSKLFQQLFGEGNTCPPAATVKSTLLRFVEEEKKDLANFHESAAKILNKQIQEFVTDYITRFSVDTSSLSKEALLAKEKPLVEKEWQRFSEQTSQVYKSAQELWRSNISVLKNVPALLKRQVLLAPVKDDGGIMKLIELSFESIVSDDVSIEGFFESLLKDEFAASEREALALNITIEDFASTYSAKDPIGVVSGEKLRLEQFHINLLGALQVHSTLENRLALTEFEHQTENDRVKIWSDLYQRQVGVDEQRSVLLDFSKQKQHEQQALQEQLQAQIMKSHQKEVERQQQALASGTDPFTLFERERALSLETTLWRDRQLLLQKMKSQIVLESDLSETLLSRRSKVLSTMKQLNTRPELVSIMRNRLNIDDSRLKAEALSSYSSFEESALTLHQYCLTFLDSLHTHASSEVTSMSTFVQEACSFFHHRSEDLILTIAKLEDLSKRNRIAWRTTHHRIYEEQRVLTLARSTEDLEKMYQDIHIHEQEEYQSLDVSTAAELWKLKNSNQTSFDEKRSIHDQYFSDVQPILESIVTAKSSLRDQFGSTIESKEIMDILSQMITTELKAGDELFDIFKSTISKLIAHHKVEDELSSIRRTLHHESEEVEELMHLNEMMRLNELMEQQQQRKETETQLEQKAGDEVAGKLKSLEQEKDKQIELAKQMADIRQQERERQLVSEGLPAEDARKQAETEKKEILQKEIEDIRNRFDKEMNDLQSSLQQRLDEDLQESQKATTDAISAISAGKALSGPDAEKEKAQVLEQMKLSSDEEKKLAKSEMDLALLDLAKNVESERQESENSIEEEMNVFEQQRKQQLLEEGFNEDEASAKASEERNELQQQKLAELSERLEKKLASEQEKILSQYEDKLKHIDESLETALNLMSKGFEKTLNDGLERLRRQLADEFEQKKSDLMRREGVSDTEAAKVVSAQNNQELEDYRKRVETVKSDLIRDILPQTLQKQKEDIHASYTTAVKGLEDALQEKRKQQKNRLAERLQNHLQKESRRLQQTQGISAKDAEEKAKAILAAANIWKDGEQAIDEEARNRLKEKHDEFEKAKDNFTSKAVEQANIEDHESMQLRQDLRDKNRQLLINTANSTANVLSAATDAAKAQHMRTEKEVSSIRDAYKTEMKKLEDEFEVKLQKEKKNLQQRLKQRQQQREHEIKRGQPGATSAEIQKQISEEELNAIRELEDKLSTEKDAKLQELKKQALQAESALLEREHQKVLQKMKEADQNKQSLQEEINKIKLQHEDESKTLQERLDAKKKHQEDALKQRLAERKSHKLALQQQAQASEEERKRLEEELHREEQQMLLDLQRQQAIEEEKEKERQRQEQEAALAKVLQDLQNAEMEAAIAAAKEKSMNSVKAMQAQVEQDNHMKEVQKLRAIHDMKEEKRQQEISQAKTQGKEKLNERLAAKRAKKERELKEQEEKAMAELAAKQKAETEEKERLRQAKLSWTEKLQEIINNAKNNMKSVTAREREDYCCQQVFNNPKSNLRIPDIQLNEAVSLIMKDRHDEEMTSLLTRNFDERITSLRGAVESIIEEKSAAKIRLVENLSERGAGDDMIRQELTKLDEDFTQRQLQAEKAATASLEEKHVKAQLSLKKQQLAEVAEIVSLYTDPETLKRIQQQTAEGKNLSPEEQLQQYQQRLENERKAREAQLQKEREESEQRLRQQLQDEMKRLESEIASEQKKVEQEYEKKRLEVMKQKEELNKKQMNEKEALENLEKQRILQNFEKEQAAAIESLNADRLNKKARLTERLNRRRSTAVVTPLSLSAVEETKPAGEATALSAMHRVDSAVKLGGSRSKAALPTLNETGAATVTIPPQLTQSISLIESKLERIEKVISALEKSGITSLASQPVVQPAPVAAPAPAAVPAPTPAAPPQIPVYQDRDEPAAGDRLEVVEDSDLAVQERARLDFGKRIAAMIGIKNLNLQSATSLPPSRLSNNSFSNSYHYTAEDNTLFVHHNRLSSSGDFGLVVIHALSHIKVNANDLSNDNDPKFMAEFYKNLKILSQDLYKKTAVTQTTNPMMVGGGTSKGPGLANKKQRSRSSFNLYTDNSSELQQSMLLAAALAGDDGPPSPSHHFTHHGSVSAIPTATEDSRDRGGADYFSHDSLVERMKMYAQQGGIPLDYIERYSANANNSNGNSLSNTGNLK
eukprot:CAMPEP_0173155160 /NCGR_PEP_ID=MMETSP1105-20130129/13936_1 /TAXON_ID=2985 /ORGANISM="Ochromonas sp., Strain BG-1" /LENGTH=2955 /DNA_ID=CAMNT_0014071525 /DNA_START=806 /DNA_END=9673 /DNA_ORIENTATION=-